MLSASEPVKDQVSPGVGFGPAPGDRVRGGPGCLLPVGAEPVQLRRGGQQLQRLAERVQLELLLVAIGLLKAALRPDLAWRIMLALGAVPALAVFWLRRRLRETPRFLLAQAETAGAAQPTTRAAQPAGIRGVLAEPFVRQLNRSVGAHTNAISGHGSPSPETRTRSPRR